MVLDEMSHTNFERGLHNNVSLPSIPNTYLNWHPISEFEMGVLISRHEDLNEEH